MSNSLLHATLTQATLTQAAQTRAALSDAALSDAASLQRNRLHCRPPLSPMRIVALSGALALHAAGFALFVTPHAAPIPQAVMPRNDLRVDFVAAARAPALPVPPVPQPPTRRKAKPVAQPIAPQVIAESTWQEPAAPIRTVSDFAPDLVESPPAPPVWQAARLAYDRAPPPPFPSLARRNGWQGQVLLRVQVDEQGRPRAVEVDRSSGHRLLDKTARDHVLAKWRFQPAMVDGRPAIAWALVPVNFSISSG